MDDGRCLLDVIDDPDALTSFLDNQDEFGLDSADLEEFSRYQVQPLSSHGQYAALGSSTNTANPSAALQQPEMPSSVLMRLENISPPPIQNDTVLSLLGDRPFTPTSNKALLTSTTTQPSAPASRPIIDLGFGEQEGGEIKEIFPDFQSGSVSGSGQMHSTANQIFSQTDDFLAKLAGKESTGSSQVAAGKDDFSSIFSFEEDEKSRRGAPAGAISTSSVQDVIQQSLLLSGVGNLATDAPEQGEEMATKLQTGQQYASIVSQQNVVQTMRTLPGPAAAPTNLPMSSAYIPQAHPVPASSAVEYQKATTKSIPQVAVVRPQTQPQPQPQTQVLTQPVLDSQGQVISSQFLQAPGKVIVSGQQPMQMPMQQQTYLLNTKAPLNIQAKPGLAAPPASKTPATQPQGIRIMLAPQTGGNIQTLGGAPAGQTIHLNQGQTGAPGQQTVVLHNVQGAVQQGAQSSVPVLQPVITIGATQGSLIFMARPTTVLAPQQLQQLQTTGSGLATIQVPNQHLGSVVQQNAITVNQQPSGKQTLPIVQLVQPGVQGAKTYQTITLPQGYVTGGQTIVIQNPQGTANVLPIAQNQARIVQSGNNQVSFVQTQPTVTYGKVQGAPQLIQPKIVSTAQPQTKVFPVTSQSIASTAYRTKEIAPSPSPASRAELTKALSQAPTSSQIVQPVSSISAGQILPKSSQSYIQDMSPGEVLSTKTGATATSKAKPVEFRHKLYGKISTVQPEAKQALGHSAKVSSVQSQQPTSTLQTILQKVQPHQATGKTSHLSQVQSSAALSAPQSQSVFVPQNSPPATTTVTPSNVNAKGLPNLTQTLPGNNGSVAASVHHPQLSAQLTDANLSSAATQVTTSLSTIQSASTLPTKQRNGGSQLKKQNMFGSRQTSVETAATNTFQDAFLKAVQAKVGQTVVSNSTMRTTVSSTVTATVAVSAGRGVSHIVSQGTVGAASSAAPIMSPSSAGARIPQSIAGNTPHTTPMISALELKAKQTQNIPTVNPNQPMVSALQLKAQQRLVSQGGVFQQQPPAPSQPPPQMAQTQPMISALQLKNAGRFQGQGLNISTPSNAQPMISALEIQQQIQQQQQQQKGISFSTAQSSQSRPMANVLQAQQMQRQMGPENAERLNQLVQLQQRQNAAQGLASQVPIPRPPSAGQSLPSPQGIPMGQMQSVQPLTGPQRIQSQRPPSRGQPLPSPQGVQSRPPSAGPPMASPHGMHPHPPSPMNQPLQSPQGRQTPRPPSAGRPQSVGHPMPSPQESLASPQSIPASPLQSPHSMLQSPTNVAVGSTQRAQSNPNMFQQFQHPAQGVHGTIGTHQQEQAQPVANQGSVQTSAGMMPQLLQAFDLLKKAQAAQAKGQLGAAEQAHYTEQFQGLLQKHPELTRQLQNLKKAQVAKQNQMKQQQQLAMSLPAPAFKQGQPSNPAQQFNQQPQQPPTSLSASAGQAQLVASSILQATQNVSAANSKSASGGPQQQFVRQVSYNQSGMTGQGMSPFPAQAPSSAQAMNPNYTPNVTIQTVGMGQKDGTQRGMSAQGAFIQNQNQPPAVLGMKRKPVSPSISMPPPPRPAPQQPPPNVSILPSQKQAPLGTVPSVTKDKEKDVFEFDDDDPQPPKIETKFSRKAVGNRAASMTVHHQPALFPGQLPPQQPQQTSQAPALGSNPAMMSFAAPHIKQSPNLGQMPVSAPAAAASQPQTSTPSGQISQLSRMLQSPPQMTPPQLDRKPTIQGVHAAQVMPQGQGQGRAQGQSQPQSQQTRLLPKLEPQGLAPCSQASQGQLQDVKPSLPGPGPAGGTLQPNQFQSQDANPASLRLKQIQQNQQVLSSSFKVKQKSKLAHQQSLNSVQGFIRQLENISNRTPKQEAMLKQLLELQQKITAQASGQGLLAASGGGQPQPIAAAAATTAVAGTGTGIGVGTGVGTSGSLPVPVPNKTGTTSGAAVASIKQDPERFVMPVPVPVSVSTPSVAVNTGFTPQSYRPMVASTAGVTTKQTVGMGGQGMVNTAQQYKLGSQSRQPATTPAAMAASAAAAAAAIAQAQAAPGATPGKPPAPATLPPTQQPQGAQISIAGANATSSTSATTATPMSTAPASAPTVHQIFTTNIVQLVGKNLSPEQQGVLKNLQEQLRNMTPHQQQEFYRQLQQQLQQGKKVTELATTPVAVQPPQQPSSSTPAPKAQLSPVRARPSRAKPKKKGSKASPKGAGAGAGAGAIGDEKGGKDVELISQTPPLPPPLPPKVPTPPPAAADFIRERRDLDTYCVENIQFKSAFASRSEAIQRLLPYHIAFEKIPSKEKFAETASSFEEISNNLLEKKKKMVDKFQLLLYNESMRKESSSEMVMLERMFLHDEQAALQNERKLAEANIGLVESLMPKVEIGLTPATSGSPAKTPEKTTEHSFAQPAQVRPMKSEPYQKTNHDRIRKSSSSDSEPPAPAVAHKRSSPHGTAAARRQKFASGEGTDLKAPMGSSSTEGQYHSSIVSKYGSSDDDDSSTQRSAGSSGGGIRLRLTKSLLIESNVKSRDHPQTTSDSDDSVLASPPKPKRRKSRLEALLSADSSDYSSSDVKSPLLDYRTRTGGSAVWTVSQKPRNSSTALPDADLTERKTRVQPSGDFSDPCDVILDDDDDEEEDADVLQEQMDSAVNSILFLQGNAGPPGADQSRAAHPSLADISFDQDDVFDSADDSTAFDVDDYANASFLETSTAVAGLETEFSAMEDELQGIL